MKYTFLLSSAINTKFGVYNAEQRMQQTINTVNSIKDKVPDAQIIIAELSGAGIRPEQLQQLSEIATFVVDFTEEKQVIDLYNSTDNWDIVKNGTEIMCFLKLLNLCHDRELFKSVDRIFKISGRYVLNDNFNISYYENKEVLDKIVIGGRKQSQFPIELTQQSWQYMSRLWSWPASRTVEIMQVYAKGVKFFSDRVIYGGYVDIEHVLARFLNQDHILESTNLGIEGNISPNGVTVKD